MHFPQTLISVFRLEYISLLMTVFYLVTIFLITLNCTWLQFASGIMGSSYHIRSLRFLFVSKSELFCSGSTSSDCLLRLHCKFSYWCSGTFLLLGCSKFIGHHYRKSQMSREEASHEMLLFLSNSHHCWYLSHVKVSLDNCHSVPSTHLKFCWWT